MLQGETEVLGSNFVPLPLCPPQTSYGLIWIRTQTSAVRDRRQTASTMAEPWRTEAAV